MPVKARLAAVRPAFAIVARRMSGLYDLMLLVDPTAPEERRTAAISEAESMIDSGGDGGPRRLGPAMRDQDGKDPPEREIPPPSPQSGPVDQPAAEERRVERWQRNAPPPSGEFTPDPGP